MSPERLGPYRIDRELGSGGMGKVYAATGPDGVVALKVVHPHLLETPGFFERFCREAEIGTVIRHGNVVRTFAAGEEDGRHFLVMEYVEGQNLAELLLEIGRVPEELCRHVAREVSKGLVAVHAAGVVHRDLKPENLLITPEHEVKIMDLGVALLADENLRLSQSGAFVGSVEYASPEQFRGGGVDGRTDLHALGVLLYELASGVHPYRGDGFHEVMRRICDDAPRPLGEVNPQVSAYFEEVVHTLLVKDPRGRFPSAEQVLSVLDDGEDGAWWRQRARTLREQKKRPLRRVRIPRETAVYGREDELARLRGLFDEARAGDGRVVLIEGEAGIGKSRLVDELAARLQADGEDVSFLFGSYPPAGAGGALSTAFHEHFGDDGAAGHLSRTPLLVPAFDAVLRGDVPPPGAQALTPSALGTCFVHATRSLAEERPTIVLVDDLHFAPEDARTLFATLALAVPGHRVLLVGTTRPGLPEDWVAHITRMTHATRMELSRLGARDLGELLKDCFRSAQLAAQLALQIATKSDGNPFFAFEIVRGLREGQFIRQSGDGTWASTRVIDEIQIPSSVLDLVNARVAELTEEERDLLDVAACWGYEFDPGLIGDVVGMARIPLLKRFGQIERRHRLVRASGRSYVFDHHQVQEALYGSLHEQMREEYHGALAEALAARTGAGTTEPDELDGALCVDLCEHFLKGTRAREALRYLRPAERHLAAGYLHARRVDLLERALAVPGLLVSADRVDTLLRLAGGGGPLAALGRRARQAECISEAEALAASLDDRQLTCDAAMQRAALAFATAQFDEADELLAGALEIARSLGDRGAEARALAQLGTTSRYRGRLARAREFGEQALAISREIGDAVGEAAQTVNLGTVCVAAGELARGAERFVEGIELCRRAGHRLFEANALSNLGSVHRGLGRYDEAVECLDQALRISREIGDRSAEAWFMSNRASMYSSRQRFAEARDLHEAAATLSREIGDALSETLALANLGASWVSLGQLDRARSALDAALDLGGRVGARNEIGYALFARATLADNEDDLDEARRRADACLELRRSMGQADGVAGALILLGQLELRSGDAGAARRALEEARDIAVDGSLPSQHVMARATLACLPDASDEERHGPDSDADRVGDDLLWHWLRYAATRAPERLRTAKGILDGALRHSPAEYHDGMRRNVRLHRELLAAWSVELGDDEGPRETESVTRVG